MPTEALARYAESGEKDSRLRRAVQGKAWINVASQSWIVCCSVHVYASHIVSTPVAVEDTASFPSGAMAKAMGLPRSCRLTQEPDSSSKMCNDPLVDATTS